MAETMRGAGRLTASLITATRRLLTASTMLQPGDLFQTNLRPGLFGIHDGNGSGVTQRIGDKSVLADGDQRLSPDNEEDALGGQSRKAFLQIGEMALHVRGDRCAGLGNSEDIGKFFGRS